MGVDASTGQILASELTPHDVDDGSQVEALLDQVTDPLASFTGDEAYDQEGVYATVAERHPDADVIVLPRSTAVPSGMAESAPTQRDRPSPKHCRAWTHGLAEAVPVHSTSPGGGIHQPA
ncbi:transposase [Microvirga ossetica]|uniref:transposase n=1 Tax=Microvirga ossetica TaxID=1882682 RepID=UPI001F0200AB|nr:transposase [Microvirga ossetica]